MENHIKKLIEATKNITVRYSYAYNDGPDIGVRGSFDNPSKDSVIIDGIVWLIAGDIYDNEMQERCSSVSAMKHIYKPEDLTVYLRAQAMVFDKIVSVELGSRKVLTIKNLDDYSGLMELADAGRRFHYGL